MGSARLNEELSTRERILSATRAEIEKFGILGLRLDGVARRASISIPLIYRYFGGRDGLLAVVLGDWYAEFVRGYRELVDNWLDKAVSITLEEFALISPKPRANQNLRAREFRLQVLAMAVENHQLRTRISEITTEVYHWMHQTVKRGKEKLPESDRHFDDRIFTLLLFNTMYVFTDLVEGATPEDIEYSRFLVDLIRASSEKNSSS